MTGFGKRRFTANKLEDKFESKNNSWRTPKVLFDTLDKEFHFDIDLACSDDSQLCKLGFTEKENAMLQSWKGICYLNPPFGLKQFPLKKWVETSYNESQKKGTTVVMLIPARTNTNWWHSYCMKAKEVRFIKGRPKFIGNVHGLPQPLAIIIFEKTNSPTKYTTFDYNGRQASR